MRSSKRRWARSSNSPQEAASILEQYGHTHDDAEAAPASGSIDRMRAPVMLGLGIGAAVFMHPAIGFLVCVTLVILVLARPAALAAQVIPALGIAVTMALPQVATVLGIGLPPIALVVSLTAGVAVGVGIVATPALHRPLVRLGRLGAAAAGLAGLLVAGPVVRAAVSGTEPLVSVMELAVVAGAVAVALRTPAARNPVIWASAVAGFAAAALTHLVPEKGAGLLEDGAQYETLMFEGFGPHHVPVIVECLTDNKNRTSTNIRVLFRRGQLGNTGSVSWDFRHLGLIEATAELVADDAESAAIEAGAQDVEPGDDGATRFITEPTDLDLVSKALTSKHWHVHSAALAWRAKNPVKLEGDHRTQVEAFLETLDDDDDVQNIFVGLE